MHRRMIAKANAWSRECTPTNRAQIQRLPTIVSIVKLLAQTEALAALERLRVNPRLSAVVF